MLRSNQQNRMEADQSKRSPLFGQRPLILRARELNLRQGKDIGGKLQFQCGKVYVTSDMVNKAISQMA